MLPQACFNGFYNLCLLSALFGQANSSSQEYIQKGFWVSSGYKCLQSHFHCIVLVSEAESSLSEVAPCFFSAHHPHWQWTISNVPNSLGQLPMDSWNEPVTKLTVYSRVLSVFKPLYSYFESRTMGKIQIKGNKNFLGHHGWTTACGWPATEAESNITDPSCHVSMPRLCAGDTTFIINPFSL